jgi:hypothetical protein
MFGYDYTGPITVITTPGAVVNSTNNVTVSWTTNATDAAKYFVRLNTTAWVELDVVETSWVFMNLTNGHYNITLIGQDVLGNNGTTVNHVFTLNYIPPFPPFGGLDPMLLIIIGGAVAGVIIVIVILVYMRQRQPPSTRKKK